MSPPRVFVSYSWNQSEGDGHEEWVMTLCEQLANNGIDVILDKWDLLPGQSTTAFMEQGVKNADFVLAICTPAFAEKSDERRGGVGYEQQIISGNIISGSPRSKFLPLIRKGESQAGRNCAIPNHFQGTLYIDFRAADLWSESLNTLLHTLHQRPRHPKPKIGANPFSGLPKADGISVAMPATIEIVLDKKLAPIDGSLLKAVDDMDRFAAQQIEFRCT